MSQAIVYIRYSTKSQERGDSKRRQLEDCQAYCAAKGWPVVEVLEDLGKSAWRGDHLTNGQLGKFAARLEYPDDCVLVVERLDRLSRQEVRKTQRWLEDLCERGVKIAVVSGDRIYDDASLRGDLMNTFEILMRGKLAHDESAQKAERVIASKKNRLKEFESSGRLLTAKAPSWLTMTPDRKGWIVDEDKAEIVRDIYLLSAEGRGSPWICRTLNDRKVPSFGGITWQISTVNLLLRQPSVEGDYVPGFSNTKKDKTTIMGGRKIGYYPRIVPAKLVEEARAAFASRKQATGGRYRTGVANLFTGLLKCAHCDGQMSMKQNSDPTPQRQLQCAGAIQHRGCDNKAAWNYRRFEAAAIREVLHLAMDDSQFSDGGRAAELAKVLAESSKTLTDLKERRSNLVRLLAKVGEDVEVEGQLAEVIALLRDAEAGRLKIEADLARAKGEASPAEQAGRVMAIRQAMESDDETVKTPARLQVQTALRGMVDRVEFAWSGDKYVKLTMVGGLHSILMDNNGKVLNRNVPAADAVAADYLGYTDDKALASKVRTYFKRRAPSTRLS
jgi:DNA invertase Pin-like site-specific DNA recombinase